MALLAAFAFANLKHDLGLLWAWLCHRPFWQLVSLGLAIFALVQHFELAHARKVAAIYLTQRDGYKRQLDGISTKRNEQQVVTRDRIVTVIKTLKRADRRAKIVEAAPLPGQCRSPQQVLDADI